MNYPSELSLTAESDYEYEYDFDSNGEAQNRRRRKKHPTDLPSTPSKNFQCCKKVQQQLIDPQKCQYSGSLQPMELKFEKLRMGFNSGELCKKKDYKEILKGISGKFDSQNLVAIFGPSGSGKSTLMNILAGYRVRGSTGDIYVNGTLRDINQFRKIACYIMQHDCLMPFLSVQEAMTVVTHLKVERRVPKKLKDEIIEEILLMLGLDQHANTLTKNLSGGQRKRLAIGLELVCNPPIMFLDEPTSGLDSSTTFQVMSLLRVLAHDGRNIICTIHQPSAKLFELFDHIYVLAQGQCIYDGNVSAVVPYFRAHNMICPNFHNPADFVIEVASGEYGDVVEELVEAVNSGECEKYAQIYPDIMQYCPTFETLWQLMEYNGDKRTVAPGSSLRKATKYRQAKNCAFFATSSLKQFRILFRRIFVSTLRDPSLTHMRLASYLSTGVILGLLYYDIGNKSERVLNNIGLMFFSLLFISFAALMPVLLTFPMELPIVIREHMNYWYTVDSYFLARTISDIPFQIAYAALYSAIIYFMSSQPSEFWRFALFTLIFMNVALVSQALGLLIGAISPTAEFATFAGPIVLIPFSLFSGFFVKIEDVPVYMKWISYISFPKYALDGVLNSVYGHGRKDLSCGAKSDFACGLRKGSLILEELGVNEESPWTSFVILSGFFLGLRLMCYVSFRIRIYLQK